MTQRRFFAARFWHRAICATAPLFLACVPAIAAPAIQAAALPATRVLAIGSLTEKAKPAELGKVLDQEVRATLALYLAGKIDTWYAKSDHSGVVFILNLTTVDAARDMLERLPLGQAGLMTFELTPMGPLQPLGLLLRPPAAGDPSKEP